MLLSSRPVEVSSKVRLHASTIITIIIFAQRADRIYGTFLIDPRATFPFQKSISKGSNLITNDFHQSKKEKTYSKIIPYSTQSSHKCRDSKSSQMRTMSLRFWKNSSCQCYQLRVNILTLRRHKSKFENFIRL